MFSMFSGQRSFTGLWVLDDPNNGENGSPVGSSQDDGSPAAVVVGEGGSGVVKSL